MKTKLVVLILCISILSPLVNAMQTPAEKKLSQDRLYIKRGLTDVLNKNSNFFAGTTINELNRMIDLGQSFLKSKDSINYFKVELIKNDDQVTSGLNSLIQIANDRLMQKGEPSRLGKPVQATAQKPQAKQVAKSSVKNTQQVANSQKKPQNNNAPKKPIAPKPTIQASQKAVLAPQKDQVAKANVGNSNNDPESNNDLKEVLWKAALDNDVELVKWHIEHGSDVNKGNPGDDTPLSLAINNENEEIIDLLLNAGANVNKANLVGQSPLMYAIYKKNIGLVKKLIEAGAKVNVQNRSGFTVLALAARSGNVEILKLIIQGGADLARDGLSAMGWAGSGRTYETFKYLKELLSDPKIVKCIRDKKITMWEAAAQFDNDNVKKYLKNKSNINDVNELGQTVLMVAAENGNIELVEFLLAKGADLKVQDIHGNTALHLSVAREQINVSDILIQQKVGINQKNREGHSPLWLAVRFGNKHIVEQLIQVGANVRETDANDASLLMILAYLQPLKGDIADILIEAGANVNFQDDMGVTALMISASRSLVPEQRLNQSVIHSFLLNGALLNTQDLLGRTARDNAVKDKQMLDFFNIEIPKRYPIIAKKINKNDLIFDAIKNNNLHRIKQLINKGNIEIKDEHDATPLALAVRWGTMPMLKFLVGQGAKIDNMDEYGMTPLQSAVIRGNLEMVTFLIDRGANINHQDSYRGRTPLHYAVRMTEGAMQKSKPQMPSDIAVKMIELLISKGANRNLVDHEHQTPLDWARSKNQKSLIDALQKGAPKSQ